MATNGFFVRTNPHYKRNIVTAIVILLLIVILCPLGTVTLLRPTLIGPQGLAGAPGQSIKGDTGSPGKDSVNGLDGKNADPSDPAFIQAMSNIAATQVAQALVSVPTAQPGASVAASCPTEREFKDLTGVIADIDRTEPCAFHWRGDPKTLTATHPCPNGWNCTLGVADPRQTYVYKGDDALGSLNIFAGTWRLISKYPAGDTVYDQCAFLAKVNAEGRISDPQWNALAGNFVCP